MNRGLVYQTASTLQSIGEFTKVLRDASQKGIVLGSECKYNYSALTQAIERLKAEIANTREKKED